MKAPRNGTLFLMKTTVFTRQGAEPVWLGHNCQNKLGDAAMPTDPKISMAENHKGLFMSVLAGSSVPLQPTGSCAREKKALVGRGVV